MSPGLNKKTSTPHHQPTEEKLRKPARLPTAEEQATLKFYNPALHTAAFALPEFARRKLDEARAAAGRS